MEFNGSQQKTENDCLKNLITYFAYTVANLTEVKLDKLIYIAHLYHYSNYGELLTKTRFFGFSYGPHAPLIRSTLKKQLENRSLFLTESRTSSDPVYSNPCLIIKTSEHNVKNLSCLCLNTLREVVEDWGGEPISWTLIQPYRDLKYVLSLPQRVQIHRFVEEPEKTMFQHHAYSEWSLVSINEVAEIYLALSGELPDKIPSQGYLGFNLQNALYAFDNLQDKNKGDTEKYPTEIDKAAQLTDSLLKSMSFRSYSSRVALKTGMFFLKKLGYSFDGDALEEHWPDGNSHKILMKWFSRVSVKVNTKQKSYL
jgi:prophage maintenance system killer protein